MTYTANTFAEITKDWNVNALHFAYMRHILQPLKPEVFGDFSSNFILYENERNLKWVKHLASINNGSGGDDDTIQCLIHNEFKILCIFLYQNITLAKTQQCITINKNSKMKNKHTSK